MPEADRPIPLPAAVRDEAGLSWSVLVVDAASGVELCAYAPDRVLQIASVGKVLLLIEVARRVVLGDLDPFEPLERGAERIADSGLWHVLDVDALTIADACRLVGAVSDNLATNVLIDRIGLDSVARTAAAIGCRDTALLDRVREPRLAEHPPTLARGSAREIAGLFAHLSRGDVVDPATNALVLEWLALGTDLSMVAGAFGLDPLAHVEPDRGLLLRHKTGTLDTVRADAGVLSMPGRALAYAVVAEWSEDAPSSARDRALRGMHDLGFALCEALAR